MRRSVLTVALAAMLPLGGCEVARDASGTPGGSGPAGAAGGVGGVGGVPADYDAGAVPGGPGAGRRYGLGSSPARGHVARMDRDVGPDGAELPPGRGTVAEGDALYKAQCAMCHGLRGEGMEPAYPALIGRDPAGEDFAFANDPALVRTIGNYWPHATTLFDYVRRAMPLLTPGTLTDDQVYALTAYLLAANDVIPDTATLDAAALRAVRMPYQDRFIRADATPAPSAK
jgi:S-disulfanyl-L-cysteine oxidoreductase SoxD